MSFFNTIQNFEEIPNIDKFFQRSTFNNMNDTFENVIFGDEFDANKLFSCDPFKDSELFFNNKEFSKQEITTQANSSLPSTFGSDTLPSSQEESKVPREILGKRNIVDLNSSFSEDGDIYLPATNEEEEEEEYVAAKSQQTPSKIAQNKMKNHPGSIAAKIRRLAQVNKKTGSESRIFQLATMHLASQKIEEFRRFTTKFHKTFKTWVALTKFLGSNSEFGIIFINMIDLFLSESFNGEYEEWLDQSQMNQQTKILLKDQVNKKYYITKFSMLRDDLSGVSSEMPNAINKTKKFLKIM